MKREDRKAAIAAYKERKSVAGIYALRCIASGQNWIGQAPNVETVRNRLWFTLKFGSSPHRALQKAWRDHGDKSFAFEVLERMPDDEPSFVIDSLLEERMAYWKAALDAQVL